MNLWGSDTMKIYLFLQDRILTFSIPLKVSGSFSFDENPKEEAKLINIEAVNNEWTIYSTLDVNIIYNDSFVSRVPLKENTYYWLRKKNATYLIYAVALFDDTFSSFSYSNKTELLIGNSSHCNLNFLPSFFKVQQLAKIYVMDNEFYLSSDSVPIYVNNKVLPKQTNLLKNGDQINIYGLRIILLNNIILINNPNSSVKINLASTGLSPLKIPINESEKDLEVQEKDLYTKDDYFFKSPRVRRQIKEKEINLSPPPQSRDEQKLPMILTVGPMFTMGIISGVMLVNNITKLVSGEADLEKMWPQLVTSCAMLISMMLWPTLTKIFNKKIKKQRDKELIEKYSDYLKTKKDELMQEGTLQKEILTENLKTIDECLQIIGSGKMNFWDKRIDQNDFLDVRLGVGNELLKVQINYPEQGFSVEEDALRKKADEMVEKFKYIYNVPIGYSLYNEKITAIMGDKVRCHGLIDNIILQLISFYTYDDIKIVVFTNDTNKEHWDYIKYLNHSFSNDKSIRFFSTNIESAKNINDYLNVEIQRRIQLLQENGSKLFKPYYIIISDDYSQIKRLSVIKALTEIDANLGFSFVILENRMGKLPSKCNNFISLADDVSVILKNSFEQQKQIPFHDEIKYNVDMMQIVRKLSNIPVEFEEGNIGLPESITFLEMERVGKVEQLNILNRWETNDSTQSLKAEIGVDEEGSLMYLDLHEKYHGPHGLIAGMTGSGKSEFIITYILSMAINYSPDDVAFILIDYKGGGLAFAFENKATGVSLPHLAGTITNLDKAEMDRTLVSIDSEIKRRQKIFNEARDLLGESTIDIYKYQKFFKEGKLKEAIPHLFIICDEFAELKSQQPDFMDNLISVARIGRSLGVHLILATQKPSGVVNDQIWSNTKFRVCLKVQDASDSKEMLKRPEAASLKQTGRFYLQVGYDEYFALGQSAWCGAKYYPSEKIVKKIDKSVNFINDSGNFIKSIQAGNNIKIEAQGEQLSAIMNNIIEISNMTNKRVKRLWLNDIDSIILVDNLKIKYNVSKKNYDVCAIIGEYDAPEKQEQGLLLYSLAKDGNTAIFGTDEVEREKLINTIIYSICTNYVAREVNIYILDYGSESTRMFSKFPQIGGIVFANEDEEMKNLFKLINEEIKTRKKLLIDYGGSIENYNSKNTTKLPQILLIINNYDGLLEEYNTIYEDIATIARECERYGIYLVISCGLPSILGRKTSQCFSNRYALHLPDSSDYFTAFGERCRTKPRNSIGRGIVKNGGIHEFQTASILSEDTDINDYLNDVVQKIKAVDSSKAPKIPTLPEKVTFDLLETENIEIDKVPIGISKNTLKLVKYDFSYFAATNIASNRLANINSFMDSLIEVLLRIKNSIVYFIDPMQTLPQAANKVINNNKISYLTKNLDTVFEKLTDIQKNEKYSNYHLIYVLYGLEKVKAKSDVKKLEELFNAVKSSENGKLILCDSAKGFKSLEYDTWYTKIKNNTDGIWIGKGFGEQQVLRIGRVSKEMNLVYPNNYGFCVKESSAELMKVLEFNELLKNKEDDDDGE